MSCPSYEVQYVENLFFKSASGYCVSSNNYFELSELSIVLILIVLLIVFFSAWLIYAKKLEGLSALSERSDTAKQEAKL